MVFYLLAYITGGIQILFCLINFIFSSRKKTLALKIAVDAAYAVNSLFVFFATNEKSLITAIVVCTIGVIRDIIFYFKGKNAILDSIYLPIAFSAIYIGVLHFTYIGTISLIPAIGSIVSTFGIYQTDRKKLKIISFIGEAFYSLYYSLLLQSSDILTIFSLASSTAVLIGIIIGLIRQYKRERLHPNSY